MLSSDHRAVKAIMDIRLREAQARAEVELLLRQVQKEPRGWLSQKGCRLLRQVGRGLVAWGRRLERTGLAPAPSPEQAPRRCCGA